MYNTAVIAAYYLNMASEVDRRATMGPRRHHQPPATGRLMGGLPATLAMPSLVIL